MVSLFWNRFWSLRCESCAAFLYRNYLLFPVFPTSLASIPFIISTASLLIGSVPHLLATLKSWWQIVPDCFCLISGCSIQAVTLVIYWQAYCSMFHPFSFSMASFSLTNWRQCFLCVCPLIEDKLHHNVVKVVWKSRVAGDWFPQ